MGKECRTVKGMEFLKNRKVFIMRKKKQNRYIEELDRLARAGTKPSSRQTDGCREPVDGNKEPDSGNNFYEDEELEEEEMIDLLPYEPDPNEAIDTLHDLYAGIVLFSLLILLIGVILVKQKLSFALGVFLGGAVSCGLGTHMYRSLDVALELPSDAAVKYTRRRSGLRMIFMGITVGVSCIFPTYLNVFGVVFGLLTLKFSAYLQPVIHIFTTKILKGR